jgi:hypothetical protein
MVVSLYICEIPKNVTEKDLENIFCELDGYIEMRMKGSDNRKIAFVDYETDKEAKFAMETLQGFKFSQDDPKGIVIKISDNTKTGSTQASNKSDNDKMLRRKRKEQSLESTYDNKRSNTGSSRHTYDKSSNNNNNDNNYNNNNQVSNFSSNLNTQQLNNTSNNNNQNMNITNTNNILDLLSVLTGNSNLSNLNNMGNSGNMGGGQLNTTNNSLNMLSNLSNLNKYPQNGNMGQGTGNIQQSKYYKY